MLKDTRDRNIYEYFCVKSFNYSAANNTKNEGIFATIVGIYSIRNTSKMQPIVVSFSVLSI